MKSPDSLNGSRIAVHHSNEFAKRRSPTDIGGLGVDAAVNSFVGCEVAILYPFNGTTMSDSRLNRIKSLNLSENPPKIESNAVHCHILDQKKLVFQSIRGLNSTETAFKQLSTPTDDTSPP